MSASEANQWHVTWSTEGRQPVAVDDADRRALVRVLVERMAGALVMFAVVDDHVHAWLIGRSVELHRVVRSAGFALLRRDRPAPSAPFVRPVERRAHAEWLVPYLLGQPGHHGFEVHPALWSGGCFADLVGARVIGEWNTRLPDALPRFRMRTAYGMIGLPEEQLAPMSDEGIAALGASRLALAAAAAFGVGPGFAGRPSQLVGAVVAGATLARSAGIPLSELGAAMGRARETISRAAGREVSPRALRAVRLRLALEEAVAIAESAQRDAPAPAPAPARARAGSGG